MQAASPPYRVEAFGRWRNRSANRPMVVRIRAATCALIRFGSGVTGSYYAMWRAIAWADQGGEMAMIRDVGPILVPVMFLELANGVCAAQGSTKYERALTSLESHRLPQWYAG